jgi:hypothetical protein
MGSQTAEQCLAECRAILQAPTREQALWDEKLRRPARAVLVALAELPPELRDKPWRKLSDYDRARIRQAVTEASQWAQELRDYSNGYATDVDAVIAAPARAREVAGHE